MIYYYNFATNYDVYMYTNMKILVSCFVSRGYTYIEKFFIDKFNRAKILDRLELI